MKCRRGKRWDVRQSKGKETSPDRQDRKRLKWLRVSERLTLAATFRPGAALSYWLAFSTPRHAADKAPPLFYRRGVCNFGGSSRTGNEQALIKWPSMTAITPFTAIPFNCLAYKDSFSNGEASFFWSTSPIHSNTDVCEKSFKSWSISLLPCKKW